MGPPSGDLDPGLLLFLLRQGWTVQKLETLLDLECGLAGISALSSDLRMLLEKCVMEAMPARAVEMFSCQVRKFIGAYAAVLNGLDSLVFTGGIGERAGPLRGEIVRGLKHLGVTPG